MFIRSLFNHACFAPEGAPEGGTAPEPQTFSLEYVRELRAENKGWRLKASELEGKLSTAEKARDAAASDAEGKVTEAKKAADARILTSEMRTAAKAAGMVDLDGLKLIDTSTIKLKDDGTAEIPADFFSKAREAKPYLFTPAKGTETGTTSTTTPPPPASSAAGKHAKDLSAADFDAELRRLTA